MWGDHPRTGTSEIGPLRKHSPHRIQPLGPAERPAWKPEDFSGPGGPLAGAGATGNRSQPASPVPAALALESPCPVSEPSFPPLSLDPAALRGPGLLPPPASRSRRWVPAAWGLGNLFPLLSFSAPKPRLCVQATGGCVGVASSGPQRRVQWNHPSVTAQLPAWLSPLGSLRNTAHNLRGAHAAGVWKGHIGRHPGLSRSPARQRGAPAPQH